MSDLLRLQLVALLGSGRSNAISARQLAQELGTTERHVGQLVAEAIEEEGYAVGSTCTAPAGYFLCRDATDVELGSRHIRYRAINSLVRLAAFRKAAAPLMTPDQLSMFAFDLEEVS